MISAQDDQRVRVPAHLQRSKLLQEREAIAQQALAVRAAADVVRIARETSALNYQIRCDLAAAQTKSAIDRLADGYVEYALAIELWLAADQLADPEQGRPHVAAVFQPTTIGPISLCVNNDGGGAWPFGVWAFFPNQSLRQICKTRATTLLEAIVR